MRVFEIVFLGALIGAVSCAKLDRDGRFFRYQYTSTSVVPRMVTSLIPSSCVQVEPSLPPCRNVRNLDAFPRFLGGRVQEPAMDIAKTQEPMGPSVHSTVLGWGEYLGFYNPTVTVTAVHLMTTTVQDPHTVVTFSVKGCKPSKLPMGLDLCPQPLKLEIRPTATVQETLPTMTVPAHVPATVDIIQPAEEVVNIGEANNGETEQLPTS